MILATRAAAAQDPITPAGGVATVRIRVIRDTSPEHGVAVTSGVVRALTDARGWAALKLPAGSHRVTVASPGVRPDTVAIVVRAGADTSIGVRLVEVVEELTPITVTATRGERRIEKEPVRVEVVTREEIVEKLLMTPGDIAMLPNETPGLRVQTTSPSLGAANVPVSCGESGRSHPRRPRRGSRRPAASVSQSRESDRRPAHTVAAAHPPESGAGRTVDDRCVDRAGRADDERGRATRVVSSCGDGA